MKLITSLCLALLLAGHAAAATYYVSPNGDDARDGATPATAWRSFGRVNKLTLGPGDRLLLERGGVWNQELVINGRGAEGNFVEIGAYGEGPRPRIQRNGHIADRCVRINNASYLKLWGLEVCEGGAGIVLFYDHSYHNRSVYIDDVVAHGFRGIYRGRGQSSRNPQWQAYRAPDRVGFSFGIGVTGREDTPNNRTRVLSDLRVTNCRVYNTGAGVAIDWFDHTCVDGTVANDTKFADVLFENLHLHDNTVEDVSLTCLWIQMVNGLLARNIVIDNGCYQAPAGTAAIHLNLARNVVLENVTVKNTPSSGSPDNSAVSFESEAENVAFLHCTFENNAGPALSFLCNTLSSTNVQIENCVFVNNHWTRKFRRNSGQIHVANWALPNRPTGHIRDCLYVNSAEVDFFNGDGFLDGFALANNRGFETAEALAAARVQWAAPEQDLGRRRLAEFLEQDRRTVNLALGKTYTKSMEPAPQYPDTNNREGTDGRFAGDYRDGLGFGFPIREPATEVTVDITIDLGEVYDNVFAVGTQKWMIVAGSAYGPDRVSVFTSVDGRQFVERGSATAPSGFWHEVRFEPASARYAKIRHYKGRGRNNSDWLFMGEFRVLGLRGE